MSTAQAARVDQSLADVCARVRSDIVPAVTDRLGEAAIECSLDEVEVFYRQACHGLFLSHQSGKLSEGEEDFLAEATYRRALDALDARDVIAESAQERRALEAVSADLRARFRQVVLLPETLRVIYGRPAPDSVFVDRVEAELDAAIGGALAASWCSEQSSLVGRYALGALSAEADDYRDAVDHLQGCENCRRHAQRVRTLAAAAEPNEELLAAVTARVGGSAAGPSFLASARRSKPTGKIMIGVAAAAALLIGAFTLFSAKDDQSAPSLAAASSIAPTTETSAPGAAQASRKAIEARKLRAQRARAKRAAAKRRAAAARRAARQRAAAAEAAARARAQQTTTQSAPQTQTQTSTPTSKPKSQPKPSTDPSEEFGN